MVDLPLLYTEGEGLTDSWLTPTPQILDGSIPGFGFRWNSYIRYDFQPKRLLASPNAIFRDTVYPAKRNERPISDSSGVFNAKKLPVALRT